MDKEPVHYELAALLQACSNDLQENTTMLVAADWCQENGYKSLEWLLRYLSKERRWRIKVLFTGSRCYGTPKPESDFDWVVYLLDGLEPFDDYADSCSKSSHWNEQGQEVLYYGTCGLDAAMRFGPVNLICVTSMNQFMAWETGTRILKLFAPVTRERAVDEFKYQFERLGCNQRTLSTI